jgi:acyl carrier protein
LREKLIALIEEEVGATGVTESTLIEALGIDSLDFIALLQAIRADIGPISIDAATSASTVGDLIAAVRL